jgi:choline dehydrogenase-like flavoprotein
VDEFDYIIVGQGLAGSILACLLRMEQKRVLLIDNGHRTAASMSAAGIIRTTIESQFSTAWARKAHYRPLLRRFNSLGILRVARPSIGNLMYAENHCGNDQAAIDRRSRFLD